MYVSYWVAVYLNVVLQQFMPKSVRIPGPAFGTSGAAAVLLGATIVLAWTAPRKAALSAALAASAGLVSYTLVVIGGPTAMVGPRLLQVLALIGLAALAPRTGHPSRHWLWLPGVIAAGVLLALQGWRDISLNLGFLSPWLPLVAIAACGVLWVCVDARLIVTVLTFLAVSALQMPMMDISSGFWDLSSLAFLGVVLALAAPAVWLMRRQSARPAQVAS
jgi:hypothetical protein